MEESARTKLSCASVLLAMMQAKNELSSGKAIHEDQGTLKNTIDSFEKNLIANSIIFHKGNVSLCARALGVSRAGLLVKIKRHGLDKVLEASRTQE